MWRINHKSSVNWLFPRIRIGVPAHSDSGELAESAGSQKWLLVVWDIGTREYIELSIEPKLFWNMKLTGRISESVRVCIYIYCFLSCCIAVCQTIYMGWDWYDSLFICRWGTLINIGQSLAQIVRARVGWQVPWIGVMSLMRPTQRSYLQPRPHRPWGGWVSGI